MTQAIILTWSSWTLRGGNDTYLLCKDATVSWLTSRAWTEWEELQTYDHVFVRRVHRVDDRNLKTHKRQFSKMWRRLRRINGTAHLRLAAVLVRQLTVSVWITNRKHYWTFKTALRLHLPSLRQKNKSFGEKKSFPSLYCNKTMNRISDSSDVATSCEVASCPAVPVGVPPQFAPTETSQCQQRFRTRNVHT